MTQKVDDRLILAFLGLAILLFVGLSWMDAVPKVPPNRLRLVEGISAVVSALIGGLTTGWAAPMSAYLMALRVDKAEFIRATGFLISAGSLPLCLSYLQLGHMNANQAALSVGLVVPTIAGFYLGERLRHRVSNAQFRSALLWVFLALGLNLLYRAAFSS